MTSTAEDRTIAGTFWNQSNHGTLFSFFIHICLLSFNRVVQQTIYRHLRREKLHKKKNSKQVQTYNRHVCRHAFYGPSWECQQARLESQQSTVEYYMICLAMEKTCRLKEQQGVMKKNM